jgi:hypothetical protein
MAAINDGGPAFPATSWTKDGDFLGENQGMTLRDYFAAKAMHAHLMTDAVPGEPCDALLEAAARAGRDPLYHLCVNAYEVADNMLRARAEGPAA